eukprot:gene27154-2388_t
MTIETVDTAVNEFVFQVRPYSIADGGDVSVAAAENGRANETDENWLNGGDVSVAAVENGRVFLKLQGACGTCPSSVTTMKMGIERSLKAAFGEDLKEVIQEVDKINTAATASRVDEHLDVLRPAITNFGGKCRYSTALFFTYSCPLTPHPRLRRAPSGAPMAPHGPHSHATNRYFSRIPPETVFGVGRDRGWPV